MWIGSCSRHHHGLGLFGGGFNRRLGYVEVDKGCLFTFSFANNWSTMGNPASPHQPAVAQWLLEHISPGNCNFHLLESVDVFGDWSTYGRLGRETNDNRRRGLLTNILRPTFLTTSQSRHSGGPWCWGWLKLRGKPMRLGWIFIK